MSLDIPCSASIAEIKHDLGEPTPREIEEATNKALADLCTTDVISDALSEEVTRGDCRALAKIMAECLGDGLPPDESEIGRIIAPRLVEYVKSCLKSEDVDMAMADLADIHAADFRED